MSRFNQAATRAAVASPVVSEAAPSGLTFEGAPGFARDPRSELFLLAVAHLGDGSFYESADDRSVRFTALVHGVAMTHPEWMAAFVPWLRDSAGMRTASLIAAAETAWAWKTDERPGGRQLIASALRRADEPGELLAYWTSRHGRSIPKPVKRGIGDAALELYTEYALLKYDTASHGYRFGDVLDLVHAGDDKGSGQGGKFKGGWQRDLFRYALDRRHNRDNPVPESLRMIRANQALRARAAGDPSALLDSEALRAAGMTWEDALSLAGNRVGKQELWTALVPLLGYTALLRNLRNIDEAGVTDWVASNAAARLAGAEEVRRSRMFPFRFLSAYRAVPSLRWGHALEQALNHSLGNVPRLAGRTLVLVDRSPSMWEARFSEHSTMPWADAAALFGAAVALRAEQADLVEFWGRSAAVRFGKADSLLRVTERFSYQPQPGGTDIPLAVKQNLRPDHARVVIVTDEQTQAGWLPSNMHQGYGGMAPTLIDDLIPQRVPVYMWNFGGYERGAVASGGFGTRHTFGGLTDHAFRMVPMLEAGRSADWKTLFAAEPQPGAGR